MSYSIYPRLGKGNAWRTDFAPASPFSRYAQAQPMNAAAQPIPLLAPLWERYRPLMLERLQLLDYVAATDPLPAPLRRDAIIVAHNLSGSLGMFGYAEGTRLAREMEETLHAEALDHREIEPLCRSLRQLLFGTSDP